MRLRFLRAPGPLLAPSTAAVLLLGCQPSAPVDTEGSSSTGDGCVVGQVACECTPGGGCDPGLQCVVGVCIPEDLDTGVVSTGVLGSSDVDSAPPMEASTSTSTSTATGEPATSSTGADDSSSSGGIPSPCGNGRLEEGEVCDDGNTENGDGCNADCMPGGQEIWSQTFDGGLQLDDWAHRVAIDADDDVYVVGLAFDIGNTQRDGLVIKYDDDGQLQWSDRFDNDLPLPNNSTDFFWGVAIAQDQSVVVTGTTTIADNHTQPVVRMYSPDGDVLWTYVEPDVGDGYAYDVVVDSLGDIVVTGSVHDPMDYSPRAWLAKLTPAGDPVWNLRLQVPTGYGNTILAIDSTDALIMGDADGFGYVRKLDTDGAELWTWSDVIMGTTQLLGAATGPADEIYVTGHSLGPLNAYLAQHPVDGLDPVWTLGWPGTLGGGALALAVAVDGVGRVLTTGTETSAMTYAVYVRKHDANGDPIWLHEVPTSPNYDLPYGLAVDSLDQPVVAARQYGPAGNYDIFVRKLTQ